MLKKETIMPLKDSKRYLLLKAISFKINFKKGRCAVDTEQLHLVKFRLREHQKFQAR